MSTPGTEALEGAAQASGLLERRIADGPRGGAKTWFDVLDVPNDVTPADLHKAYERALALVDGSSIGGYLMLDPMAAESARADVEAAFAVLGDPERRQAYQERLAGTREPRPPADKPIQRPAEAAADTRAERDAAMSAPEPAAEPVRVAGWSAEGEPVPDDGTAEKRAILGAPAGDSQAEERRASHLKFLAPEGNGGAPAALPRTDTPGPGSIDIRFETPSTDSGTAPALPGPPARQASTPPEAAQPPTMLATSTVSPTAAMPPPTAAPDLARAGELPEEITGTVIRELREARGLDLDEVSLQTKVRRGILQAIEEQDILNLPARVYLRGFLTQVGRVLKVDRNRLAEGYLKTIEKVQRG